MKVEGKFFPKGAISFFLFLIAFYVFLWLLTYILLLERR